MPAATIIGTTKGIFGTSQTIAGFVIESTDFSYLNDKTLFPDKDSNTTAVAYSDEKIEVNIKGLLVNGTSWAGTLTSLLTLTGVPAYLSAGNTGGKTIVEDVKVGEAMKAWRTIDIGATYYPYVA